MSDLTRAAHPVLRKRSSAKWYLTIGLFLCLSVSVQADTLTGKVVAISDGDTITVLDSNNKQHRVRLQGIDAPEKEQAFGNVSKENLASLIFGKQIIVNFAKLDRYGRIVGKVLLDGKDINLEQLKTGLAWFYRFYEEELNDNDRKAYAAAEAEARAAKRGLWKDPNPVPPYEFRQNGKPTSDAPEQPTVKESASASGPIIGNKRSKIYHWPGCPDYNKVAGQNREYFKTKEEAKRAGYRAARNCP